MRVKSLKQAAVRRWSPPRCVLLAHRGLIITVGATAIAAAGCLTIAVKSPDGASSASYTGTSIVGGEDVSCGTMAGVVTCSGSGQNIAGLAQAIAPYLAQYYGIRAPAARATATPTPIPAESPAR